MIKYYFNVSLSYERFLPFYQGKIKVIQVTDDFKRRIDLPAEHFRQFLTRDGIVGRFELTVEQSGKFISLDQIY